MYAAGKDRPEDRGGQDGEQEQELPGDGLIPGGRQKSRRGQAGTRPACLLD